MTSLPPILNLKLCFGLRFELPSSSFLYKSGMISSFNHSNDGVECNFIFSFHSGIINSKKIAKIIDAVSVRAKFQSGMNETTT